MVNFLSLDESPVSMKEWGEMLYYSTPLFSLISRSATS